MKNVEIGKYIDVNGINTNYHDLGKGKPVLFLHGSGPGVSAWVNWRFNIVELSKTNRVIAPDIVGFGFTKRPKDNKYSLNIWINHVISFLNAINIKKTSIVGNSFGGALAIALAVKHPQRVNKLI